MSFHLVVLIVQLLFSISIIFYGLEKMFEERIKDEPFGEYENLGDCIANNLNKRDPEQYCRAIRSKVRRARRRKRGG